MDNKEEKRGNLFRQDRNNKHVEKADESRSRAKGEEQVPDLDGDGMVGNTGGFYGGTSYVGSNYGEDWNKQEDTGEGNYGASGFKDRKAPETDPEERKDDQAH